jgi:hypothetical protein
MIAWCAWASAALALLLVAAFIWVLVDRSVLVVAGVPTLVAAAWAAQQSLALFLVRRPVSGEQALAAYRTVFRAVLGVAGILLLGDFLLLVIGRQLLAALGYAALTALATGVGLLSLRSIAANTPR